MDWLMRLMTQTSLKAILDCNQAIIETDFRAELPKIKRADLDNSGRQGRFSAT